MDNGRGCRIMDWNLGEKLGEGSFGNVFLGTHQKNDGFITKRAIKHLKGIFTWEKNVLLRELQMLASASRHPHMVELHEIILQGNDLYYVFEYMPHGCLHQWIQQHEQAKQATTDVHVRSIVHQVLQGLNHLHQHSIVHRDVKPENILRHNHIWKIADFSLARKVPSSTTATTIGNSLRCRGASMMGIGNGDGDDESTATLTSYVSTRWYRAPEVLLHCAHYGTPIDVFALACVTAELYNHRPIFPGQTEVDQLHRITSLLGTTPQLQHALATLSVTLPVNTTNTTPQNWNTILPTACPSAIHVVRHMIAIDPEERWTCSRALKHPFFANAAPDASHSETMDATNTILSPETHTLPPTVVVPTSSRANSLSHPLPTTTNDLTTLSQAPAPPFVTGSRRGPPWQPLPPANNPTLTYHTSADTPVIVPSSSYSHRRKEPFYRASPESMIAHNPYSKKKRII